MSQAIRNEEAAPDFLDVTELAGDDVTEEQIQRLCNRYFWAGTYCQDKDVVEVACGTGQGLGYLQALSRSLIGADISEKILDIARQTYGSRVELQNFSAETLPFADNSKDVIILFEAIYYIPQAEKFVAECQRVLRPGGVVLIATANRDLFDFNPSPYSFVYYGVRELKALFAKYKFNSEVFGDTPLETISTRQKILRPIKKFAVKYHLIPQTMAAKKLLKRLVFGDLKKMPAEITAEMAVYQKPTPLSADEPCRNFKVIYCAARK